MNKNKYNVIIPFLAPAIILYLVFVIYPYGRSMYNSLTSWKGVSANQPFVGMQNYVRMINDEFFWNALLHNLQYLLILPLMIIFLSLFLAFMISQGIRGGFIFPCNLFLSTSDFNHFNWRVVGVLLYHPTIGVLTSLLQTLHLEWFFQLFGFDGIPVWIGDPRTVRPSIAAVVVWQAAGFYMVLFLAAMEAIPQTFYEAAIIDGASRYAQILEYHTSLVVGHDADCHDLCWLDY